jgi:hypothetical protein
MPFKGIGKNGKSYHSGAATMSITWEPLSLWAVAHLRLSKTEKTPKPEGSQRLGVINGGRRYWGREDSLNRAKSSCLLAHHPHL